MKTRPINFKAHEVRATREGRKTQTRRIVKPQPYECDGEFVVNYEDSVGDPILVGDKRFIKTCPHGEPGDLLWVKEAWRKAFQETQYSLGIIYRADKIKSIGMDEYSDRHHWKPSILMPRQASRITLEIASVRVQRLQDISEDDAMEEGVEEVESGMWRSYHKDAGWISVNCPVTSYRSLWESTNGPGSWDLNPWVWVVEFKEVK